MRAVRYYVITNPDDPDRAPGEPDAASFSGVSPIDEVRFAAAVADRLPDARADMAGLLRSSAGALTRELAARLRRFPRGAVVYWRVNEATGQAEGWVATATDECSADPDLRTRAGGRLGPPRDGGGDLGGAARLPSL